jgi:hypothetical protein
MDDQDKRQQNDDQRRTAIADISGDQQLSLLQAITLEIGSARDLPSELEGVLRRVCEKTGWALARGKGEINTGTNHVGFRCVLSAR